MLFLNYLLGYWKFFSSMIASSSMFCVVLQHFVRILPTISGTPSMTQRWRKCPRRKWWPGLLTCYSTKDATPNSATSMILATGYTSYPDYRWKPQSSNTAGRMRICWMVRWWVWLDLKVRHWLDIMDKVKTLCSKLNKHFFNDL